MPGHDQCDAPKVGVRLDAMLGLCHIGVLVPWANTVVESELPRFGLTHIVWHYARLVPDNQGTVLDAGGSG